MAEPPEPDFMRHFQDGESFYFDESLDEPGIWGRDDKVLWPPGEPLLLCGSTGVGKTTLAKQLARARVGLRDEVLGFPVVPGKGTLLYFASDRPKQAAKAGRRLFTRDEGPVLKERLVIWKGPILADLRKVPTTLLALARLWGADTVIIDSAKDVAPALSTDEGGVALSMALQHLIADDIEVMVLHHQRKPEAGGKANTLDDVYGSTFITASAGSVVLLSGKAGDPIVDLIHLKQPIAEVGPLKVEHDHITGISTVIKGHDLLRFLATHPKGVTATEVAIARFEVSSPTENQRKKARRDLISLVNKGLVHQIEGQKEGFGGPSGTRYFLVERGLHVVGREPP
jgi:replicative DNA helicase